MQARTITIETSWLAVFETAKSDLPPITSQHLWSASLQRVPNGQRNLLKRRCSSTNGFGEAKEVVDLARKALVHRLHAQTLQFLRVGRALIAKYIVRGSHYVGGGQALELLVRGADRTCQPVAPVVPAVTLVKPFHAVGSQKVALGEERVAL